MRRDAGRGLHAHVHQRRTQQGPSKSPSLSLYISNIGHSLLTLHYWFSFAGTRIWGRRETIQEKRKEIERGRKREDWGWEGKRERREWWQTTSSGRTQTSLTPPDAVRYSLSTLKSKTSSALTLSLSSRFLFFSFFFLFLFFFQIWLNVVQSIVLVLEKVLLCLLHRLGGVVFRDWFICVVLSLYPLFRICKCWFIWYDLSLDDAE